jgi:hypothetical protein
VADPKRGLDLAFVAIAEAADFEAAESHLGHTMEDLYRLYELARQPPSTKVLRDAALEATDDGKTALAMVWGRKFRTHEVVEVSQAADMYSDYYTNLYGVLAWRPGPTSRPTRTAVAGIRSTTPIWKAIPYWIPCRLPSQRR